MLSLAGKIIFSLIILATVAAFGLPVARRLRIIRAGRPLNRFDKPVRRVWDALMKVVFQRCTLKNERLVTGAMHVFIFYGALSFDTMTVSHTLEGFIPGFYLFGQTGFGLAFSFLLDLFAILVLLGVGFLAVRRFLVRPPAYATTRLDSALIYVLITAATLSYLYFESLAIAHDPQNARWAFLGQALAAGVRSASLSPTTLAVHFEVSWWLHILVVFGFIAYVPHSKYFHMFTGPFNVLFRSHAPSGTLPALDLEKSETFGLEKAVDMTWKDHLDSFACMECGRCQDACPAYASAKPLSPKMILFNQEKHILAERKKILAGDREALKPLCPDVHAEDEVWTCTTCGACQHVCPVEIGHIPKIVGLRQSEVLMKSRFPQELNAFFRNMETNSNPWGVGFAKRADWAEGLAVKKVQEHPGVDHLFWVGCAGSFDEQGQKIARAFVSILEAAGVHFAILGTEEKCCGDSARRLGQEYLFQTLAAENIGLFAKYGIRKILTFCPHGYNAFKNEYPRLAEVLPTLSAEERECLKNLEVLHSVEFLNGLVQSGRLSLKKLEAPVLTYHDSCYLGRHNGLVNEPRALLSRLFGAKPVELAKAGAHSFCCGAGGGLMWTEEKLGTRINHLRAEEVLRSGADFVATSCPFCQTMLLDAFKDKGRPDLQVKDIVQLVADALPDRAG